MIFLFKANQEVRVHENGKDGVQNKIQELEEILGTKKKERDLMMSTHFKLIKSNEKLSLELAACKNELHLLKYS